MNENELDRDAMRRSFERAAAGYDAAAVLQARVRTELLERLALIGFDPRRIADVGCGTGHAAVALAARYPDSRIYAVDLSEAMLQQTRHHAGREPRIETVCADAVRLPFEDAGVDLLFCNLMLQWCDDLPAVFAEFQRVLSPRGLLSFSTFGPDTLTELRAAWAEADGYSHVNRFLDMHDIGDALVHCGLAEPVLDVERFTLTYGDVRALMRDLKAIGAHNVTRGRPRGLTGRRRFAAVEQAYARFGVDGRLPATYEVVYGQAWAPQGSPAEDGEVYVPVARIGRRRRML